MSLLWIGLVAGMMIGGRYFVPAGSGLAGPAIALGYGVAGAAIGAVLAALLIWRASVDLLHKLAWVAVVLGFAATAFVVVGIVVRAAGSP